MTKPRAFYVYVLEDPRDGSVFYVGKGLGLRMHQHSIEGRKRQVGGNRRKLDRICEIQAAGFEPLARKIAEYADEAEAFEHEADLIAASVGLTNILARGGGWAITAEEYERRCAERSAKYLAREREKLRDKLRVWDEWERRGWIVTFPGLADGDKLAQELVRAVREFIDPPTNIIFADIPA